MSHFYITTPIYYVNDLPHIGHIYSTLVADTVARYRRLCGDRVYFLTGTDEHGQKIERAAAEQGIPPIALGDRVVSRYHELWAELGVTHDDFLRTSEERHHRGVREVVRRMAEQGDLYVGRHEGWYCVRCEAFYTDKELLDGNLCPEHETTCEKSSEENLFFRLSKYQQPLLELYERNPHFVRPESRLNEVRSFVAQGLDDLSVSRTTVSWGVPFPGHQGHTVYVWLDALVNYISALGFGAEDGPVTTGKDAAGQDPAGHGAASHGLYADFWAHGGQKVHLVGKDILRFHAVFWPAFLLSAELPLPDTVWAHGWWLRDSKKMSKSTGNVVRPDHLVRDFGSDALRFHLLREMVFGQDATFSDEAFVDRYNSDLANDLGNTVSRLVTLSRRAFDDCLPPEAGDDLKQAAAKAIASYRQHLDAYAFQDALRALWQLLQETNQYLVRHEPWKKMKDPAARDEVSRVLYSALEAVRLVAVGLLPILPEKGPKVLAALGAPVPAGVSESEGFDFELALAWGGLPTAASLGAVEPLFPRIDKKTYLSGLADGAAAEADSGGGRTEEETVTTKDRQSAEAQPPSETGAGAGSGPAAEPRIAIDHFFEVVLKVAEVQAAEPVAKSNKLLKLTVDVGEASPRTVVAGIAKHYAAEELVGRQVVVVANLQPAKLMGVESNGMVLAASEDGKPVLLAPDAPVPPGTRVR